MDSADEQEALVGFAGEVGESVYLQVRCAKRLKRTLLPEDLGPHRFLYPMLLEEGYLYIEDQVSARIDAALAAMNTITSMDCRFQEGVSYVVPWPAAAPLPTRMQDENSRVWLTGRSCFTGLLDNFLKQQLPSFVEMDGAVGGGKSHLALMLSLRCLHDFGANNPQVSRRKRLVCMLVMPPTESVMLKWLQYALWLAFWDDKKVQRMVATARVLDDLVELVDRLNAHNDFYFIWDEFEKLDNRLVDRSLDKIWQCIAALETDSRSLRVVERVPGRRSSSPRLSHNEVFTQKELTAFLSKQGISKQDELLLYYTGYHPLLVSAYVRAEKEAAQASSSAATAKLYVVMDEVRKMIAGVKAMVGKVGKMEFVERDFCLRALSHLLHQELEFDSDVVDSRWILLKDGKASFVCDFARDLLMATMEAYLPEHVPRISPGSSSIAMKPLNRNSVIRELC